MPNNEPSSGRRGKTLSRFKKWLREKYPRVYGFFFSKTPFYIHHFFGLLVSLGILGGFLALTVPLWKSWNSIPFLGVLIPTASTDYSEPKAIADLRLHILYITGGIIAILTLLQTNWKNQGDRLKIDADIKKNEQDAEKNERDHIRQVHAERRSRYTKAVEQLANEKATVRLGGIYTLVGLVDEWLADDTLDPEEQQKEGQVIVNNLCSYVRSPFPLAAKINNLLADSEPADYIGNFVSDQATLRDEQEVRQTIFTEISLRVKKIGRSNDSPYGPWGTFNFAFQGSNIFYPLNNLYLINADFRDSIFWGNSKISFTQFYGCTNLQESTFQGSAIFSGVHFEKEARFNDSIFKGDVKFSGATFSENAMFPGVHFHGRLEIFRSTFWRKTTFLGANFFKKSVFNEARFIGRTTFSGTKYCELFMHEKTKFYNPPVFHKDCIFFNSIFEKNAIFNGTVFRRKILFIKVKFESNPLFSNSQFNPLKRNKFTTLPNSKSEFIFGEPVIYNGCKYPKYGLIPAGVRLFDPESWNERQQKYTNISDPMTSLDNSSDGEEDKSA